MQMERAFTTESCSFSGRGSLISNGGSSGVRLSSSGKNLERTRDLPSEQCENMLDVNHKAVGEVRWLGSQQHVWWRWPEDGWVAALSAQMIGQGQEEATEHREEHRDMCLSPRSLHTHTHNIHKMSIRSTNKHSSVVKVTNSFPLTLMAPRQNP